MGRSGLRTTDFFFRKINAAGFLTHFVDSDIEKAEMTVRPAKIFGNGIEVICRYRAAGSFIRRYGGYACEGQDLGALVEVTLKDDGRGDPPITRDTLDTLGIMSGLQHDELGVLTKKITAIVKDALGEKGMELYDIKLEFGRIGEKIALIDEISGGNMRVFKNGKIVQPLDIARYLLD